LILGVGNSDSVARVALFREVRESVITDEPIAVVCGAYPVHCVAEYAQNCSPCPLVFNALATVRLHFAVQLEPSDFVDDANRTIYDAMLRLHSAGDQSTSRCSSAKPAANATQ
jgi:hypothetical protein